MAGVQRAVPPSKHAAGRLKPMGERARRLRGRAERQRIRDFLDQQTFATIMSQIETGEFDG